MKKIFIALVAAMAFVALVGCKNSSAGSADSGKVTLVLSDGTNVLKSMSVSGVVGKTFAEAGETLEKAFTDAGGNTSTGKITIDGTTYNVSLVPYKEKGCSNLFPTDKKIKAGDTFYFKATK